jgi:uncharacterized membrane protein
MRNTIATLITSKRFIIALSSITLQVALALGLTIPAETLATMLTAITTITAMLIGGISVSDAGKALSLPPGVDHKGRSDSDTIE